MIQPALHVQSFITRLLLKVGLSTGAKIGKGTAIGKHVVFTGGPRIRLGREVKIYDFCRLTVDIVSDSSGIIVGDAVAMNYGCFCDGSGGISIGTGSLFGPNVCVFTSSHAINGLPVQQSGKEYAPVNIGKNVWIGANAVVLRGVTIGDGAVVGAGSIVTRDVAANTVVAGAPARTLRLITR